jgi:hypothetical protein
LDVSAKLLNDVYRTEKDADVRERFLLVRRVREDKEVAATVAEREFHRSRWWAYKWLKRFDKDGLEGVALKASSPTKYLDSGGTFFEVIAFKMTLATSIGGEPFS